MASRGGKLDDGVMRTGVEHGILGTVSESFGVNPLAVEQFRASNANANRQQMLQLLGLTPANLPNGMLGTPLFGGLLNNSLADTVGGITGAIGGLPGGGGGGSGGGGGGLFDQLLGARGQFGQAIMGELANFGESQRQKIGRDWDAATGSAMANLERRGMGSSSLAPNTQSALEEGRQQSMLGLEDALIGQRVGALQNIGEGLFGSVENQLGRGQQDKQMLLSLLGNLVPKVSL